MDETETVKYIIDPNGDVSIRLRNANAPFAVLREDEELYIPANKFMSFYPAAGGSNGLFGSAFSFGTTASSGATSSPRAGGLFGSTTSSGTAPPPRAGGLFGSTSNTTSPSSGGLFGSTSSTTSPSPSSGLFGTASLFNTTAPSSSTTSSTGLFGSTSSSTGGGLFGSTTFGASAPPRTESAFGGFTTTFRTSASPRSESAFGGLGAGAPPRTEGGFGGFGAGAPPRTEGRFGGFGAGAPPRAESAFGGFATSSGPTTTSNSTSAASSSGDIPQTQPQPSSNAAEHEPNKEAPQESNESAVKPEEHKEPSTDATTIYVRVSSAHMKLASQEFKKALAGDSKELRPKVDGRLHVDASDWDEEALLIVLRVIHGQNRQVPKIVDLELLAKIAVIVDYYKCHEVFDAFAELWLRRLKDHLILLHKLDRDLMLLLFVSWVFRWANEFKRATGIILRQSKGQLHTLGLPIPESITSALNTRRWKTLHTIGFVLEGLASRFRSEPPHCSFECASMNLGALSRQMHNKKELANLQTLLVSAKDGQNIVSTMEAARTIRSPNWSCTAPKGPCNLALIVKTEIDKLDNIEGLDIEDFVQAV
ncbi:hypothetical protein F5Y19DRAFT_424150 [Xylariaceae sp. FL1651]|nr:hypothetical protein F5Y19DRAFT_424150 [Xylariaceae sp. FL1651]